jgi:hypothetical protein
VVYGVHRRTSLQTYTAFSSSVSASSKNGAAAKALADYLTKTDA